MHNFSEIPDAIKVEALPDFCIQITYSDGVQGHIDLKENVGQGVFAALTDLDLFSSVHLGEAGQISWSDELEICPDAAYLKICSKLEKADHACN